MRTPEPNPDYDVLVEYCVPDFEQERLFVMHEIAFAKRKIADLKDISILGRLWARSSGIATRDDWKRYVQKLERYEKKMADHLEEIQAGLVPVKIIVVNTSEVADSGIAVTVTVDHGTVREAKKVPKRPERMDAPAPGIKWPQLSPLSGFWRYGVKMTEHQIMASFSRLAAGDSAYLVNRVVYVEGGEATRMHYEVRSRGLSAGKRGQVDLRG